MKIKDSILIVEDDRELCKSLSEILVNEGFAVITVNTGEEAIHQFSPTVDVIILDVMLPGMSGIDVCREIRRESFIPILFLTAKSEDADKLLGLYAGGDDYLVKPFSFSELTARIHALLRRTHQYNTVVAEQNDRTDKSPWLLHNELRIHVNANEVYLYDRKLQLTEIEYQILLLLAQHPGMIFSLRNIFEAIWETQYMSNSGNLVTVHIRNLRKKIEEDPQKPAYIRTVWGKGYQFVKIL